MAEKVTFMKLKVDLECEKCFKKVKKVLAKYPQIRDQKFDHKGNFVFITVVCCSPEKIRDKLCSKGGGSIKSIEILPDPPKPKPAEPDKKKDADKPKPAEPEKKKDAEKPKDKPKAEAEKPKPAESAEKKKDGGDKPKDKPAESKPDKPAEPKPGPPPVKLQAPVTAYPPMPPQVAVPVAMCVGPYYEGGPCVNGYVGPPVGYNGYYSRPVYDSYGGGRPYYVSRCDQYFSEENAQGCTIM